jgi:arginyl-tRNA synthetase
MSGKSSEQIMSSETLAFGSLCDVLTKKVAQAFASAGAPSELGRVVLSERRDLSDYQCNGALAAARELKQNPRQIAERIIETVKNNQGEEIFSALAVDGPGFINFSISDKFLISQVAALASTKKIASLPQVECKYTVVDFGGPNIAKPMHVGHLRSSLIGDCLQRLCHFLGLKTVSDIHLGDWGTPMGMLIMEMRHKFPELKSIYRSDCSEEECEKAIGKVSITIDDLEQLYPQAARRCQENKEDMAKALWATAELQNSAPFAKALWKRFVAVSIEALKKDFDQMGVHFDLWNGEASVHDRIAPILERLKQEEKATISDGALIIPLADPKGKEEIPPLILTKSDGAYLYGTTDVATLDERINELHIEQMLYVVDKRQSLHFKQLFLAGRQIGLVPPDIVMEHIAFGTVNGPDRKPFKTRAGGVMKLKDLIEMATEEARKKLSEMRAAADYDNDERESIAKAVGMAALKYGDLMHDRTTDYVFDLEKFTRFEGRTGPYILYAAVRIKAILRKAKEQGFTIGPVSTMSGVERELMLEMLRMPDQLYLAYHKRMPNYICDYAYDVAYAFNRFYLQCHILSEKDEKLRASWLGLSDLCLYELEKLLCLLGIDIPERM